MTRDVSPILGPTFEGYIATELDALILFEECLRGERPLITRRPSPKECEKLVKSGNILIFDLQASQIGKFVDGISWSRNITEGSFRVYQEVSKHLSPSTKKHTVRRKRSIDIGKEADPQHGNYISGLDSGAAASSNSLESTTTTEMKSDFPSDEQRKELKRSADSSWTAGHDFLENGLFKKTMAVKIHDTKLRMVYYYRESDIEHKKLARLRDRLRTSPGYIRKELHTVRSLHQLSKEPENHAKRQSRDPNETTHVSSPSKVKSHHPQAASDETPLSKLEDAPTSPQAPKKLLNSGSRAVRGYGEHGIPFQSKSSQQTGDSRKHKRLKLDAPYGLEPLGLKFTESLSDHAEQPASTYVLADASNLSHLHDANLGKRHQHKKSKDGCKHCKRRRIKCDGHRPQW
jgi:hypothetical protein